MIAFLAAIKSEIERDAMGELFKHYYPQMKGVAYGILRNPQDAEDAAMNAVAYICNHCELFMDYTSHATSNLIFICTRSAAIDMYRKNKHKRETILYPDDEYLFFDQIPDDCPSIVDIVISQETRHMMERAIGALEDQYRIPIVLHYCYQMRNVDIAEMMHIDANTVNGRIFRAKKMLKQIVQQMGYKHE